MSFQKLEQLTGVNRRKSLEYREYFRAKRTRRNTSVMAPPELRNTYFVSIPFARLACQVLSERIELDSIKAETPDATEYARKALKAWGGESFVTAAHMAAMEYGRAYLVPTGTNRMDGIPGCQVVPGRDMIHAEDPFTGEVVEALRVYGDKGELRAYYTPSVTQYLEHREGGWEVVRAVPTADGKPAVFPLICRDEVDNPWGRPEAKDVFTLQDAACREATDMAIASATMAVPQRVLSGVEGKDFVKTLPDGSPQLDENGDPVKATVEELYMARLLTLADPAAKIGEYTAAQLQNFTTALNATTRLAAAVMGIPQSVFGVASDANPASGDAIRQDDARLIRRAEQLTSGFKPAWSALFEYILSVTGFGDQTVATIWVDPSLPNLASRTDAVLKLAAVTVGGVPLYDWEELRHLLGDSQEVIDAARERIELARVAQLIIETTNTPVAPVQAAA